MLSHKQAYSLIMRCIFCGWHCSLERHSGPQGKTGGNRRCCGNSFFHSGSSDTKRAPVLLFGKLRRGIEAVIQPLEQFVFHCHRLLATQTYTTPPAVYPSEFQEVIQNICRLPQLLLRRFGGFVLVLGNWAGQIGGIVLPGHCGPEVAQHLRNLFRVHSILQR